MTGASQSALSIQNPSQTGPRTQGDGPFVTHGSTVAISSTPTGEESSAIRAIAECAVSGTLNLFVRRPRYLSSKSTPPPVALTATHCCVEETRTITPACSDRMLPVVQAPRV